MPTQPMQPLRRLLLILLLLGAEPAWAQPDLNLAGIHVPDHVTVRGENLVLNGAGLRSLWGLHIYVAALYLPEPHRDASTVLTQDAPSRMELTLLRTVNAGQNLEGLKDGLLDNNPPEVMRRIAPEVERFLDLLRQARQMPASTRLRLDYIPGAGTALSIGDKTLGVIPGTTFNKALLKIWLGEAPIQLGLKKALLGQT